MDPFALDAGTAERLVRGAVDAGDAPPEYRAVARVLRALRSAPDGVEWANETGAIEKIAAAVVRRSPTRRARRTRRPSSRAAQVAAAALVAAAVCVTGGFASAGSLPEPAQRAASTVLGTVGISVPTGGEEPAGVEQPAPATAPATPTPDPANAGAPTPTIAAPPAPSTPTTPGNGKGTPAHGSRPSTAKGHDNDHSRNGSPPGVRNGKSR
jgi:hypothetical protein